MTKNQIREFQKEQRDRLTQEEQKAFSKDIRQWLFDTAEYRSCVRIFTFISFRSEVDTYEIIEPSLKNGKKVYVPRVEPQGMEFYEITGLTGLVPSKFGVPEPPAEEDRKFILQKEQITAEKPDYTDTDMNSPEEYEKAGVYKFKENLMLLPGLAFDRSGNRIGYGAGYYDRYLSSHSEADFYKAALAYGFQMMDNLPVDEYDIKADAIITPDKIYRGATLI
jgi:5-formyltetrahydrofolate cyclo-ligase